MGIGLRSSILLLTVMLLLLGSQPQSKSLVGYQPPFSQHLFPCQEDEVLGYSPMFGPDEVGCISLDLIPD